MSFSKRNLGSKIYLSLGLTGGFLLLVGATAAFSITSLRGLLESTAGVEARKVEICGRIAENVARGQAAQRGVLLGAMTADAALLRASEEALRTVGVELARSLSDLDPLLRTRQGRDLYGRLKSGAAEWVQQAPVFESQIQGQRFDEATKMQAELFRPLHARMQKDAADLVRLQRARMDQSSSQAASRAGFATWFTVIFCLVAALVAAAAFWVMRGANVSLRRIASEIAEGSRQVASAASQVSCSSQALAQGSSEQAASLEETSASTEELNSMTQKNAENASTAAGETEKADQLLKETNEKLGQMIESMKEINTSSEKISRIIRVIDEIAFQTNILALNAAVEAARAGEAGMGFAVVADEVRNLSQRCAQAAKDTSDLIEESIVRSNEGKVRLDEVTTCVSRVFENASKIRILTNEVHVGSQEQARGIEQIARAVAQMQQVTQATAASAEEGASAGEQMTAQAQHLQDAVERLRELVGEDGEESAGAGRALQPARAHVTALPRTVKAFGAGRKPARAMQTAQAQIPLEDDFRDF